MALTIEQQKFVQELANLAWGTGGSSEHAAGGKGNMGVLYGRDGTVHVVKFNTHYSQAKTAQRQANDDAQSVQAALASSNALRNELEKLAKFAGMNKAVVNELLGDNANGKSLLTRRVVATFVTRLADTNQELNREQIWHDAETAAQNLKSASDMSFDKVSKPDELHAKFNRAVTDLNGEVASKFRKIAEGVLRLGFGGNPFRPVPGWKGCANSELTTETIAGAEERVQLLKARGYGWLGEMSIKDAIVQALRTKRPNLAADGATKMAGYFVNFDFERMLSERLSEADPGLFDDVVNDILKSADALEKRGFGELMRGLDMEKAVAKAIAAKHPEITEEQALMMTRRVHLHESFSIVSSEQYFKAGRSMDELVENCIAHLKPIEARGFGWWAKGDSPESDLCAEIRALKPGYNEVEVRFIAHTLAREVASDAGDIVKGVYLGRENETFHEFVKKLLSERRIADKIGKIRFEAETPLTKSLVSLQQKFASSRFSKDPAIRENINALLDLALHYDDAIKVLGGPEKCLAEAARIDQMIAEARAEKAKANAENDEAALAKAQQVLNEANDFLSKFEDALALKTSDGKKLSLHSGNGLVPLVNILKFAHDFDKCYQLVLDKDAENKNGAALEGLFQALTEGGCFQARMELLQGYITQLSGLNAVDGVVEHKPGETVKEGLINELAKASELFVKDHPDKEPTWKNVKETFEVRVKGKSFAGVTWSAMKIYEAMAEFEPPKAEKPEEQEDNAILTYSAVIEDDDFRDKMKVIEGNKQFDKTGKGVSVHMGQL